MTSEEQESLEPVSDSRLAENERAAEKYHQALGSGEAPGAVQWLVGRGLNQQIVRTARLGVVTDPLPGHERFQGMLCIPYRLHNGYTVSLRYRCIEEHDHRAHGHGKYMSTPHEPGRMYFTEAIVNASNEISICEGEMDALVLNMLGIPAVGIPGATFWEKRWRRILEGFSRIWVWGDPDEAGAKLNDRVTQALYQARVVPLKRDVNDEYLAEGADHIRGLVS